MPGRAVSATMRPTVRGLPLIALLLARSALAPAALAGQAESARAAPDSTPAGADSTRAGTESVAHGVSRPPGRVLLIGIDGVRTDVLATVPTPHLDALAARGAFTDRARSTTPTISGPGWSSMLTGVQPSKHGVLNNDFRTNRYDRWPDFLTRAEANRSGLRTFAAADWLPLVATASGGPLVSDAVDEKVVLNGYTLGWAEADSAAVEAAIAELGENDPDAMFVYLGNPDETSHHDASIGEGYRTALAEADRQVGRLLGALEARPAYVEENWLILVSTDHGRRADGGHGGDSPEETTIFMIAAGPSVGPGTIGGTPALADLAVTALLHLGISIDPGWELDGRALELPASP